VRCQWPAAIGSHWLVRGEKGQTPSRFRKSSLNRK
jgi:hypothetical protein